MDMEDEKIRNIFSGFEPELSSDSQFLDRLQRNLHSVEVVRQHTARQRAKNKRAVALAAAVGFVVGYLCSLLVPILSGMIESWKLSLPAQSIYYGFADNFSIVAWLIVATTSVIFALNTYDLALATLGRKTSSDAI